MNKKNIILLLVLNFIFSISYYKDIQPIFNQYECSACHIGQYPSAGLRLTSYEEVINSGIVDIGSHQTSLLWQSIQSGWMPPDILTDVSNEDINIVADWIDQGARVCDEGFAYHPEVTDSLETEYINVTIQDQNYNPCFSESDLEALQDVIIVNEFENTSNPFRLGTQTWNQGRLRFLVAGYYFSGVDEIIHTIPESFGQLDDLRSLYLEWNQIQVLPDSFTNLTRLVNLYISNNQLTSIPENLGDLENLYILDLGYNQINAIPNSILDLNILTYLWIFNNQIMELPENFCDLNLNWSNDDTFGYPYFASGGNMLCTNIPECVLNSDNFNTSLEQYYYSVQITECQDCECGDGICNGCEDEESCVDDCLLNTNEDINDLEFKINNIYPNPFNPITNIDFSVNNLEIISISVFDLNGNLIENLIDNKMMNAGNYNIIWNASNVTSGIYFINFSNTEKSVTQKIILQK
ncbi:MAG: hypothetical protein CMG21_03735 [Candidatus Marinimicrobia bacterium]|nr:hypothetical protein [Candidatus Neomarinimicrobiota bacterium]